MSLSYLYVMVYNLDMKLNVFNWVFENFFSIDILRNW